MSWSLDLMYSTFLFTSLLHKSTNKHFNNYNCLVPRQNSQVTIMYSSCNLSNMISKYFKNLKNKKLIRAITVSFKMP